MSDQTDRPEAQTAPAPPKEPPAPPQEPPKAPPDPDPERKAPGFPGEARPGSVPPHRDEVIDLDEATGEVGVSRKTFSSFLIEHRAGSLHAEVSERLAEVVKAVQDHNKAGALSLTITVKPGAKGTTTLVISDDVKTKVPQGERPAAIFFADEDGNLAREDPRQTRLPLRTVDVGRGAEPRRVEGAR